MNKMSSTFANYKSTLKKFFVFCPKKVNEVKSKDVTDWYNAIRWEYKASYVQINISRLRVFFDYLFDEEIRIDNPVKNIKAQKEEMVVREIITKQDYRLLLDASNDNLRDQTIISILYNSGLRRNEIVKLKKSDIDNVRCAFLVDDDKKDKQRLVPITYDCLIKINKYLENHGNDSMFLFPSPINPKKPISGSFVYEMIKKYRCKLGLNKPLYPHLFRFTFAYNLYDADFSIPEIAVILGHDSIGDTIRYITCFGKCKNKL